MSRLRLEDGTVWPSPVSPATHPEGDGAAWRARYAPDALTRADLLWLADVARAYGQLVSHPWGANASARKVRMLRRAWRDEGRGT